MAVTPPRDGAESYLLPSVGDVAGHSAKEPGLGALKTLQGGDEEGEAEDREEQGTGREDGGVPGLCSRDPQPPRDLPR